MAMKYCPQCANRYNDKMKFCVEDGAKLVVSEPEAETLQDGVHQAEPPEKFN
jgi:hypothetical protein